MPITPEDKKISQMTEVAPSAGMFVPMVDLTQLPPSQNVRASVGSILALIDLSGYVLTSRAINTSGSLTGGGDLSADRTLSLSGDNASPGNSRYYGTDGAGTKGFFPLPSAGTGTVTSFSSGNLSPLFTTNVATATTTPALSFSLSTQSANLVFAGPANGAAAAPTFRSLVAADIPSLSGVYQPLNANLTAISALTTASYGRDFLTLADASGARTYIGAGTGSGSVTSVGLTMPSGFSVGGSPVTTTGTLAVTTTLSGILVGDGSGFLARTATGTADRISITNGSGVAGNPTFDIASTYIGQTSITTLGTIATGTWSATTIAASRGGTGETTYAEGDLLFGNGSGTLSKLAFPAIPEQVLVSGGSVPQWAALSTISVTGATGTANQVLVNGTSGSAQTGGIILTTPQDIATASTPQFLRMGLGAAADSVAILNLQKGIISAETELIKIGWTETLVGFDVAIAISAVEDAFITGGFTKLRFQGATNFGDAVPYQFWGVDEDHSVNIDATNGWIYVGSPSNIRGLTSNSTGTLQVKGNIIEMSAGSSGTVYGTFTSTGFQGAVGATTPAAGAFTSLNASDLIVGTKTGLFLSGQGTTTTSRYMNISNTSGQVFFGVEASSGGTTFVGSTAYAGLAGTNVNLPFQIGVDGTVRATFTSTGLNATAIGATTPSTATFSAGGFTGAQNNGIGGTGTNTTGLTLAGGSGAAGGGLLVITRNSVDPLYIGSYASVLGGTSSHGLLYAGAGQEWSLWADGGEKARITSTGLNSTAIGATTPSTGVFTTLNATSGSLRLQGYSGTAGAGAIFFGSGATDYIYHDGTSLTIRVGNSDRMTVTTTGINSAAIGATTPSTGAFTSLVAGNGASGYRGIDLNGASGGVINFLQAGVGNGLIYAGNGIFVLDTVTSNDMSFQVAGVTKATITSAGLVVATTTLIGSSVALSNGAGAGAGTILDAPAAGNPTKWIPINDNGTTRYIPAW